MCKHSSIIEFWNQASVSYAKATSGVVHVMLNGTRGDKTAFTPGSIFQRFELPNLVYPRVTEIIVFLVHDLGKQPRETCGMGSLVTLEQLVRAQGLPYTCIDD